MMSDSLTRRYILARAGKLEMSSKRQSIDSLKGIGILGVILVHWGINSTNDFVNGVVVNGARGVQLLFIINALLIFDSLSRVEWNKDNIIIWYKRKFLRLIPLYWFYTILYVVLMDTRGLLLGTSTESIMV